MNSEIKSAVKTAYAQIATGVKEVSCCAENGCCGSSANITSMKESYDHVEGYAAEADLHLGCGLPTEFANIKPGDTVLDLGAGAGNDAFIISKMVGDTGAVIGVDLTTEMVTLAKSNSKKLGITNITFLQDDIEELNTIPNQSIDVAVSNCVLNLVPNKALAFTQINRVLKEGGHFCISDIVSFGSIPKELASYAALYAGCIGGAIAKSDYLSIIKKAGFKNISIKAERKLPLQKELLAQYLSATELSDFQANAEGLYSITIVAEKSSTGNCCEASNTNCCNS